MLLARIGARRTIQPIRSALASRPSIRTSIRSLSSNFHSAKSTSSVPVPNPRQKSLFPDRLLIYHAGTGRIVFLGCLKVTTFFIFSFFCLVVAPSHFYAEDEPIWESGAVALSGLIPLVSVAYISGPFVNYVHLRVPPFARNSRELLMRYSRNLPRDAELDITTMNFIGKPRVARVKASELYPVRRRFGLAHFARDTKAMSAKRPWWMGKIVNEFGIHNGRSFVKEKGVWENVEQSIRRSYAKIHAKNNAANRRIGTK